MSARPLPDDKPVDFHKKTAPWLKSDPPVLGSVHGTRDDDRTRCKCGETWPCPKAALL